MKHAHTRRFELPFRWPATPYHVVLVQPQIPPNTGNVARLCAATGSVLHLIEPLGFPISHAKLKRAGLDYWDSIDIRRHADFDSFLAKVAPPRFFLFSTKGERSHLSVEYREGDALVFGSETKGLPDSLLAAHPEAVLGIPIRTEHVRSLNLSSSVAVALYEALRQVQER
ncbi:MAG: tRNA (cytidine(34)-2'-O)-methyltransferase [Verrucomicrobiota bacterium]